MMRTITDFSTLAKSTAFLFLSLILLGRVQAAPMTDPNLTDEEVKALISISEEEKLAHDVYSFLFEKWELPVFQNILQSERRHMEALKTLISDLELDLPSEKAQGEFNNPNMQALYDHLVKKGSQSVEDALLVGATIEDLDIADLSKLLDKTSNPDIRFVYQNLQRASENHIRAYSANLNAYGISYEPMYLEKAAYEAIISQASANGRHSGGGKGRKANQDKGLRKCNGNRQSECPNAGNYRGSGRKAGNNCRR